MYKGFTDDNDNLEYLMNSDESSDYNINNIINATKKPTLDNLLQFVKQSIEVLSSDKDILKHFTPELNWLKDHLEVWQLHEWRVAIIGITSSGKSTLINALLNDNLLPEKVKPSTNCFVLCRYGKKDKAVIHFKDGKTEEIDNVNKIKERIKILTDEETNPGNNKCVKEIELYWPKFILGEGVVLIDTPGLDAYKLERHEIMTMQMLHDLVDAVIFLTTAKANTDGVIAKYLDTIANQKKPLL
ncbi:MAG TPA: dynamin family protein, partial [Paludibacteraceae bacterium]|nr:dynamin family protein [Paludibacteraceae bacterium]